MAVSPQTSALRAAEPEAIPMLIGGTWRRAAQSYEVRDPYRGEGTTIAPRSCANW